MVESLISHESNVNQPAADDSTALMSGSQYGHKDMVESLISHWADMNQPAADGSAALMSGS